MGAPHARAGLRRRFLPALRRRGGLEGRALVGADCVGHRLEFRGGEPGMAQRVELRAVQLGERTGERMEAEGLAFLQDDTGRLAPDLDDQRFGHGYSPLLLTSHLGTKDGWRNGNAFPARRAGEEEIVMPDAGPISWSPSPVLPKKRTSFAEVGYEEMLARARALKPRLAERAEACERLRRLPDETEKD